MAILIEKDLTFGDGLIIPSGAVVLPTVTIKAPELYQAATDPNEEVSEENPIVIKRRRRIYYQNSLYQSVNTYKESLGRKELAANEIPHTWDEKIMTDQEYQQLVENGAIAEIWLAAKFNELLGGNFCRPIEIQL